MKTPISMIPTNGAGVGALIAAVLIIGLVVYKARQQSTNPRR